MLCLNSVTMLGAEIFGRSYGGGILKMEPREASLLPMPSTRLLERAWHELKPHKDVLERQLRAGTWTNVVKRVDAALLGSAAGLNETEIAGLLDAARSLRVRRIGREVADGGWSRQLSPHLRLHLKVRSGIHKSSSTTPQVENPG